MAQELKKMDAVSSLARLIQVDPLELKKTLKATVIKGMKQDNNTYKEITDEEFVAFVAVCNAYKLNPLTKEIYAYPDTKSKGIVPVVSTDGWNKLMTTHPEYEGHEYRESEKIAKPEGGKPCPEWMEIIITKKNGSKVIVREYLDECFRTLTYSNPWQTHTKRMLRHKTKIQGAREAFGFGGIYDHDEAGRIIEAEAQEIIPEPKALPNGQKESDKPAGDAGAGAGAQTQENKAFTTMLETFAKAKKALGDIEYYKILGAHGFTHSNEVRVVKKGQEIIDEMNARYKDLKKAKEPAAAK